MASATLAIYSQATWRPLSQSPASGQVQSVMYPEIEARFSLESYLLREAMLAAKFRSQQNASPSKIPAGLPQQINLPSVWKSGMLNTDEITHRITLEDIEELERALREFNESTSDLNTISPDTFQLKNLGPKLRSLSWEIHEGKGAVIVKGLQPDKYCLKDNIVIFAGLSSYIGDQRGRQSAQNDVLTHLYSTHDTKVVDPRPGLSNHGLPFHNDHCDVLALYVIETAQSGGTTRWSSFGHIYNEMVKSKPQVIEVLARNDWPHETPTRETKKLPLMFTDDRNVPFLSFTRFALTGLPTYPRSANAPKLTPEQADALDTVQYLADKFAVGVEQEKGDIFLVNNRTTLHARDKIQDAPECSPRHLIRLCLRDTEYGRPIPEDLKRRWGDIFDNDQHRNGKWMMNKENDLSFVSNSKFDSAFSNDETNGSHG